MLLMSLKIKSNVAYFHPISFKMVNHKSFKGTLISGYNRLLSIFFCIKNAFSDTKIMQIINFFEMEIIFYLVNES